MPRPRSPIPIVRRNLSIPEDLAARLDLALHSDLEGRVPQGDYQAFFVRLLREHFDTAPLDLGPWGLPGMVVRGTPYVLTKLKEKLT